MYAMIQQYVDQNMVIRIVGKDGIRWETVSPEDVACDYDIIPKIATDMDNRTIMRNQLIQFVTQLAPFYPRVNIYKLVKKVYSLFGFEDVDEVVPEPPEEQAQNALTIEQELAVLMQGQKIDVRYFDDHIAKLQALMQFMAQHGNQIPPQAKSAIEDKINQHANYLRVLEQAQALARMNPTAPGGGAPSGGGRGSARRTSSQSQTAVGQTAQAQRDTTRTGG